MLQLQPQLSDYDGLYVDARGRAGGLAILWKKSIKLDLLSCSSHHMDVTIQWTTEDIP